MAPPTVVIVPGACQPSSMYAPFAHALSKESIPSATVPIPSNGAFPGLKDNSADISLIRQTVTGLLDEGKEVMMIMHSYGGIPGSAALKGLGKIERGARGDKGGVIRLIYACSFALKEGEQQPGAGDVEQLRQNTKEGFDEEANTISVSSAAAAYLLFHDLPEKDGERWSSLMQAHSLGASWSKQTYAAWRDIPSTYIIATLDRVISAESQERMIKNAREVQPKAFDVVERLESGHEPFLSKIEEVVTIVKRATTNQGTW